MKFIFRLFLSACALAVLAVTVIAVLIVGYNQGATTRSHIAVMFGALVTCVSFIALVWSEWR